MMKNSMYKFVFSLLACLLPTVLLAQQSGGGLTFAPPHTDSSVVYLGNIFGVVDGVLHGTGSKMMGTIFGVFNSAVMALGGIVIMYTLMVSTMNTAQEGQMLGQKWSSIWVPMRSTIGLALLVPKASGYCLMQIFVMWVVMQGVGAADKIWNAALDYLNTGGTIVQKQGDPLKSLFSGKGDVAKGATVIFAGQVCMLGIQDALQKKRNKYLKYKQKGSGPCAGTPSGSMKAFCETPVPDFLNTFNAIAAQSGNEAKIFFQHEFHVSMPDFEGTNPYAVLNGICGSITWNNYMSKVIASVVPPIDRIGDQTVAQEIASVKRIMSDIGINEGELQTIVTSRAIAIQQMYVSLSSVARQVVNNIPGLTDTMMPVGTDHNVSDVAIAPFGVPYTAGGEPCNQSDTDCVGWGVGTHINAQSPIFNGTEYQDAISDYNTIMRPALTMVHEAQNAEEAKKARKFISHARDSGWIMAGSYFFNLARLNQDADVKEKKLSDKDSGLGASTFDVHEITNSYASDRTCSGKYSDLCTWLSHDETDINKVVSVINGQGIADPPIKQPSIKGHHHLAKKIKRTPLYDGAAASTVYGFIDNSMRLKLPGQPGTSGPNFAMHINFDMTSGMNMLQKMHLPCGHVPVFGCFGRKIGDVLYNDILRVLLNAVVGMMMQAITQLLQMILVIPLLGMAVVFQQGVNYITTTGADPIVALANMGAHYINFASEVWLATITMTIASAVVPFVGEVVIAVIMLVMPLFLAWTGLMLITGFMTAYYVPFVPYMIFTFGSLAWLLSVIEAMVAAPIVALGVTHPEGSEAFGKGEPAIMIILNVFLRPSMMIIGFIGAIILSYVVVWILNEGFQNAANFITGNPDASQVGFSAGKVGDMRAEAGNMHMGRGYTGWAGIYGFFFVILMYTSLYTILVTKSFTLISTLPDKILRWVGGQPESAAGETAQWGEEAKSQVKEAGDKTSKAAQARDNLLTGHAGKAISGSGGGASPQASVSKGADAVPGTE